MAAAKEVVYDSLPADDESMQPSSRKRGEMKEKKGYMLKQGAMRKNWKVRYFRLEKGALTYFENSQTEKPKGSVLTRDINTVNVKLTDSMRARASSKVKRECLFEVVTNDRNFYMAPDTIEERDAWVAAIRSWIGEGDQHEAADGERYGLSDAEMAALLTADDDGDDDDGVIKAKCPYCDKSYDTHEDLLIHCAKRHPDKPVPKVPCPYCTNTYDTRNDVLIHCAKRHADKPLPIFAGTDARASKVEFGGAFKCPYCERTFDDDNDVRIHCARRHPDKPIPGGEEAGGAAGASAPPDDPNVPDRGLGDELVVVINDMRTSPHEFADWMEEEILPHYDGTVLRLPASTPLKMQESSTCCHSAIAQLRELPKDGIRALEQVEGMMKGAEEALKSAGVTGKGLTEMKKYGTFLGSAQELSLSAGCSTTRELVVLALLDDGNPSRTRRKMLLNVKWKCIGAARYEDHDIHGSCQKVLFTDGWKAQ
eukprot:CAMPEP_0198314164 /NCGR_PEP_ID=MMETSP1450-20131203/4920_1 /TAXON_ID=753684 ORGANISM="Madagascaria erythrocladiodes, Strain CCMP3234" /NCGR_SAMPLE_ID=MMETSP1450 /ASSEMBLY_ACC=CAM_ASM_001115 /LENGTH=480 /DNA_ID=CAMNT_0044017203 /DNA_START=49 /DNA_END=1491 /DNA_ORIENTATION=+